MKVQNIKNIDKFWETVNSCKGKVELITGEGDRLNLKSKLTQFVALAKVFSGPTDIIPEMEIICYEAEDVSKMVDFMLNS